MPTQCQSGGQCWCVDAVGKEIFGTHQYGVPNCSEFGLCVCFGILVIMFHDTSSAPINLE